MIVLYGALGVVLVALLTLGVLYGLQQRRISRNARLFVRAGILHLPNEELTDDRRPIHYKPPTDDYVVQDEQVLQDKFLLEEEQCEEQQPPSPS